MRNNKQAKNELANLPGVPLNEKEMSAVQGGADLQRLTVAYREDKAVTGVVVEQNNTTDTTTVAVMVPAAGLSSTTTLQGQ